MKRTHRIDTRKSIIPATLGISVLGVAVFLPRFWLAEAAPARAAKPSTGNVVLDAQDKRVTAVLIKAIRGRVTGGNMQLNVVPSPRASEGIFSEVFISARPAKIKRLPLTDFALRARNVRVNVPHLFRTGKVDTFSSTTTLRAVVTENDLTNMLAKGKHTAAMQLKVKYMGDRIRVAGNWNWALLSGPVVGIGKLYLAPGHKVHVDVTSLTLNGAEVPAFVKNKFVEKLNPLIDYTDVPFQPRFKGVKVVGNKAIISA